MSGLRGVHLQCHIGTDTVSLARLGAQMSGLDFSAESIAQARRLAIVAGAAVEFVVAGVAVLGAEAFDLVYTGIGALCWLPGIRGWAGVVAGRLWSLADPRSDGLLVIEYPYFEQSDPTVCEESGTYVQTDAELPVRRTLMWNHGLGEIVSALLEHGMTLTGLVEHDSVPWEALPGQMRQLSDGEWRLADRPERLAHTYTLQAIKR